MVMRSSMATALASRLNAAGFSMPPLWSKGTINQSANSENGDLMGLGPVQTPMVSQISTSAYLPVAGLLVDLRSLIRGMVEFRMTETGGVHGITVKPQWSLDGVHWTDFGGWQFCDNSGSSSAAEPIAAGGTIERGFSLLLSSSVFNFARLAVIDTVGGSHGTIQAQGWGQ